MIKKITILVSFYAISASLLIALLFAVTYVTTPDGSIAPSTEGRSVDMVLDPLASAEPTPPPTPAPVVAPPPARKKATPLASMVPMSSQLTAPEPVEPPAVEAVPEPEPARVAPPPPRPSAPTISADDVVGVVKRKKGQVRSCYEKELKGEPELYGVVQVAWTVSSSGSVRNVHILGNSTGNQDMEACIERTIAGWSFPSSGAGVDIEYPFKFRPAF